MVREARGKRERDKRKLRKQLEAEKEEHHHLPLLVVQLYSAKALHQ